MKKIPNKYKCPKALWNKFSDRGQLAYNNVRSESQDIINPVGPHLEKDEWNVISHNYACMAAFQFNF
jgi:hypothetical protein